jgi:hypothetical protein
MNIARLENAIRVLEEVTPNAFLLSVWYLDFVNGTRMCPESIEKKLADGNTCGFVACAVGHMALDPWFNSEGLCLDYLTVAVNDGQGTPVIDNFSVNDRRLGDFFGINEYDASKLFGIFAYGGDPEKVTPAMVADRIRQLIAPNSKNLNPVNVEDNLV